MTNISLVLKQKLIRHIYGKIKEINIKNWTHYFFNDVINIEDFNSGLLKLDKKSYKNIDIYHIGYILIK